MDSFNNMDQGFHNIGNFNMSQRNDLNNNWMPDNRWARSDSIKLLKNLKEFNELEENLTQIFARKNFLSQQISSLLDNTISFTRDTKALLEKTRVPLEHLLNIKLPEKEVLWFQMKEYELLTLGLLKYLLSEDSVKFALVQSLEEESAEHPPPPDYVCNSCGDSTHLIKYCPIVRAGSNSTPYRGDKQSIGEFACPKCHRKWKSHRTFAEEKQTCKKCNIAVLPKKMYPLKTGTDNGRPGGSR